MLLLKLTTHIYQIKVYFQLNIVAIAAASLVCSWPELGTAQPQLVLFLFHHEGITKTQPREPKLGMQANLTKYKMIQSIPDRSAIR